MFKIASIEIHSNINTSSIKYKHIAPHNKYDLQFQHLGTPFSSLFSTRSRVNLCLVTGGETTVSTKVINAH